MPSPSPPAPPAPAAGLRNALASSPTSANISQLGASSYNLSSARTALQFPTSPPVVTAHAAGSDDLFATILNHILVFTDVRSRVTASSPVRLHIEAQDIAVARLPSGGAVAAVAGYDGVFVYRLTGHCVTSPVLLPGSSGYPCVAVAVSEEGAVAAGSMTGQLALWPAVGREACAIVEVPKDVESYDRITQVRFVSGGIVVAWWSGLLLRYAIRERTVDVVWEMRDARRGVMGFCEFSGSFFAFGNGANAGSVIVARGDAAIYFVDLATGKSVRRTVRGATGEIFVKGLCVSADGAFLWIRDARQLLEIEWPEMGSLAKDSQMVASETPKVSMQSPESES